MRYTKIVDIRDLDIYKNHNIRLVYLHLCLMADSRTNEATLSRSLACDRIGCTPAAYRHALEQLQKSGLIELLQQPNNNLTSHQGATKGAAKTTTKIRLLFSNKLEPTYNQASNQGSSQDYSQDYNQESSHKIKYNEKIKTKYSLPAHAREVIFAQVDAVSVYCKLSPEQAQAYCVAFAAAMERKHKSWEDDADIISHLLDWSYKHRDGAKNLVTNNSPQPAQESQEAPKERREMTNEEGWARLREQWERDAENGSELAREMLKKHFPELALTNN